jgi:hypothetical protein
MHRLSVLALFVAISLGNFGVAGAQSAGSIPPGIAVPGGHFTAFQLQAQGVQIYSCQAKTDDPTTFEWAFRAPEASLMGPSGEEIGRHYAGPTWEGLDGSTVVAATRGNADGRDADAVPWLLLEAQSHGGEGLFSKVSYVQRIDTSGGRAPTDGCGSSNTGQELRVPYTAIYTYSYPVAAP